MTNYTELLPIYKELLSSHRLMDFAVLEAAMDYYNPSYRAGDLRMDEESKQGLQELCEKIFQEWKEGNFERDVNDVAYEVVYDVYEEE